jgi:hypothetical protein
MRGTLVTLCVAVNVVQVMLPDRLQAETLRWKCTYSSIATPKGLANEKFALEFAVDNITGKAVIIGNNGMSDVDVFSGSYGLTFQEKLTTGAIQTTTIARDGRSVHSRHTLSPLETIGLMPSQYYGQCSR